MRAVRVLGLGVMCVTFHGCLGGLIGALVAPEEVVTGAASSLASKGAAAVDGATQAAGTVSDIDRILAEHPDSINSNELQGLRSQLDARVLPDTPTTQSGTPPPPSEFDRRIVASSSNEEYTVSEKHPYRQIGTERRGSEFLIERDVIDDLAPEVWRKEARPFAPARTSSIPPSREPIYQYSWNPDPKPLDGWRGGE